MGTYSFAHVRRGNYKVIIVNAYTQYHYNGHHVDYNAIRSIFKCLKEDFYFCRIGFPIIGAGLAGGDWNIISKIIRETLREKKNGLYCS